MPYDPKLSLEQMRAFLMSQGVFPQNDVYDDGASLLGQNPNMQQVGFKVPKVPKIFDIPHDPGRRTMGLTLPKQSNLPVGPQTPFAQTLQKEKEASKAVSLPQEVQPQAPSVSPLEYATEAIKNLPMTRRQVLQTPINAAISHVGRGLLGETVAPIVESAVTHITPEIAEPSFVRNPLLDEYLENYASTVLFDNSVNVPYASLEAYDFMRDYLKNRVPEKTLSKYDQIYDRAKNDQDENGDFTDDGFEALDKIDKIIDKNLKHLKPNEIQSLIQNMQQHETMSDEFAADVLTNLSNTGEKNPEKYYKDLVKYLENSWNEK